MSVIRRSHDISHRDELDTWLNARTGDEVSADGVFESDDIGGASRFHTWADGIQRNDPAAHGPDAAVWSRVMAQTRQSTHERSKTMSTVTFPADMARGRMDGVPRVGTVGRFANLAATLLMVLALAGGGYLAWMRSAPGGDEPSRFAAVVGSPAATLEAGRCDVEPLTVDEVMAIVRNPMRETGVNVHGTPTSVEQTLAEAPDWALPTQWLDSTGVVPGEGEADEVLQVARQYVACLVNGSFAQVLALEHPVLIQEMVFSAFPVWRSESDVRAALEAVMDHPANEVDTRTLGFYDEAIDTTPAIRVTNDRTNLRVVRLGNLPDQERRDAGNIDRIAFVGYDFFDSGGVYQGTTSFDVVSAEGRQRYSMVFAYSLTHNQWFYMGMREPAQVD